MPYGAGSPLIHITSRDNYISNINVENVTISNLYFRAIDDTAILNKAPAILMLIPT